MTPLVALFAIFAQDRPAEPPRPPEPPRVRRPIEPAVPRDQAIRELSERLGVLREELQSLPADSPLRAEKQMQIVRTQEELARLQQPGGRPVRPGGVGREPFLEELRAYLQESEPETFRRLQRAEQTQQREEVERILREAGPRMAESRELRERDPEAFKRQMEVRRMERESLDLAEHIKRGAGGHREEAVQKLADLLNRLFDVREEQRARELAELKRRVEEVEKSIEKRKANKAAIVDRRAKQLLGEIDEDW